MEKGECSSKWCYTGDGEGPLPKLDPNFFLEILTTEDGNLFQYIIALTEKANSLLRRWLLPCRGVFLGRVEWEE